MVGDNLPTRPAPRLRWRFADPSAEDQLAALLCGSDRVALVMVGAAGSGKTSWLEAHAPDAEVCSADAFFYQRGGGRYLFNPELLPDAHAQCLRRWLRLLEAPGVVAVDNTNLHPAEFAPYIATARAFGFCVAVVQVQASAAVCYARGTHMVPPSVVNRMVDTFSHWTLPGHWQRDPAVSVFRVITE